MLVGKNTTRPIYNGLIDEGFDKNKNFIVESLDEITLKLQEIVQLKDIVLFENE